MILLSEMTGFENSRSFGGYTTKNKKLGSGAFGDIYEASNEKGELFALKVQKQSCKSPQLYFQYKTLLFLNQDGNADANGISEVLDFLTEGKESVMVMKILGSSIEKIFEENQKRFPIQTVVWIGLDALERIEFIHSKGFIHRDIKPENLMIGREEDRKKIYLIDFGLAKKYESKYGVHTPYRDDKKFMGTTKFASVNTHLGIEQDRRDDLESLIYMLIYLSKGQLAWADLKSKGKEEKEEKILETKISTSPEELCSSLPQGMASLLRYTRGLLFGDKPDYCFIRNKLYECFPSKKLPGEKLFSWDHDE